MAEVEDIAWTAILIPPLVLGGVEGLTEFLPVSSTGHLILLVHLLGFEMPPGRVFEIAIQTGAILAVVVIYFRRLAGVATGLRFDPAARAFLRNILLTSIPAAVLGFAFQDAILDILFDPRVVAVALIAGGVVMLVTDRLPVRQRFAEIPDIAAGTAVTIGLAQSLALVPGVSRSAATIIGALLLGVGRRTAAEYSFFAAVPVLSGAALLQLSETASDLTLTDALLLLLGTLTAFAFASLAIRFLLAIVARHGFLPFAVYRVLLGTGLLVFIL